MHYAGAQEVLNELRTPRRISSSAVDVERSAGSAGTPRRPFHGPGSQYTPRRGSYMGSPVVAADELPNGGVFASAERGRALVESCTPRSGRSRQPSFDSVRCSGRSRHDCSLSPFPDLSPSKSL